MEKENPLKILWRLGQKFHSYILWITLCTVFMIQMIQRKLQFNLLEKTFQLSWSHQPGEYWWQSQCRSEEAVSLHSSYPICLLLLLPLAHLQSNPVFLKSYRTHAKIRTLPKRTNSYFVQLYSSVVYSFPPVLRPPSSSSISPVLYSKPWLLCRAALMTGWSVLRIIPVTGMLYLVTK